MKFILKYILLFSPILVKSQNFTYLALEFGPKFENYQHFDNGNELHTKPFFHSPIGGLIVGHEVQNKLAFETGFLINNYGESYRFKGDFGDFTSTSILACQLPVRLKNRINLWKNKLDLSTTVGYSLVINNYYDVTSSGLYESFSSSSGSIYHVYSEYVSKSQKRFFGLIETGVELDYKLNNSSTLYLSTTYLAGLSKVVELDVLYSINEGKEETANVFSNGDYFSILFGIRYPLANLLPDKIQD
tara:strand:+ start:837 stop:1571 length:735 start_codon:yes stop_codon:yes gene_type:complete